MCQLIHLKTKIQSCGNSINRSLLAIITLFFATVASVPIHAATITVISTNDDGAGSLRQALADANDGDTITFAVTGTIGLISGELLVSKNVTISGPGADNLAVDGNVKNRVFHISSGIIAVISGLTIRNGMASGDYPDNSGAGIYNDHATLTVTDCAFTENFAIYGGGINNDAYNPGGDYGGAAVLTIINTTFTGNSADSMDGGGGAIHSYATYHSGADVMIDNSTFTENFADGSGGAIYSYAFYSSSADLTINNSTFTGNSATYGGCIYNWSADTPTQASVSLNNSALNGNFALAGGGVYNGGGITGYAPVEINSSTLAGNSADQGGSICNVAADGYPFLTINNSTVSGNSATDGGGAYNFGSGTTAQLAISNSTISGNSAQRGGGVGNESTDGLAELFISDSTFSANSATDLGASIYNNHFYTPALYIANTILDAGVSGENIYNYNGRIISLGYNLSNDDAGGYLTGPGDQINTQPLLGPLQNNGGPTFTHKLLPGSPAKDAGNPSFTPPPDYDQRGDGFPRVVNGRIDIGALEVQPGPPCPRQPAYWKNHPEGWPVETLVLGSQTYTQTELLNILAMPSRGDASLVLAYQLIAAKLNIANGANDPAPVPGTIRHADLVLSFYPDKLPYRVRANSTNGRRMVHYAATLESYNKDNLTPDCAR